jgi:hypothetical protein
MGKFSMLRWVWAPYSFPGGIVKGPMPSDSVRDSRRRTVSTSRAIDSSSKDGTFAVDNILITWLILPGSTPADATGFWNENFRDTLLEVEKRRA